ncbi:MAG: hypothetical protein ACYCT2_05265 [Thermoplasmataceae archaeon]
MIVLSLSNLLYFLPEYIIATALSLVSFELVDRIRKPKVGVKARIEGTMESWIGFCAGFFSYVDDRPDDFLDSTFDLKIVSSSPSLSTRRSGSYVADGYPSFNPVIQRITPFDRRAMYPVEKKQSSQPFVNGPAFYLYRTAISVTVWSGAFLLITPFRYLRFFLPNFGFGIDILIDVIIGVAVFESVITAIATKTGRNSTWMLVTEFLVVLVASAALFSPAMAWFRTETRFMQLEIYSLLIFFISAITILAFLIGKKSYTFMLSFIFAMSAYSLFIATTVINILTFILGTT